MEEEICNKKFSPLVLDVLFRSVGKWNPKDLREFRLVDKSWNKAAVMALAAQGHSMTLDYNQREEYTSNMAQTAPKLESLNTNLVIVMSNEDKTLQLEQAKAFILRHPNLQISGVHITIKPDYRPPIMDVFGFSALLTGTLVEIKLNCTDWNVTPRTFQPHDFQSHMAKFPCLKSIDYTLRDESEPGGGLSPTTLLLCSIMYSSPRLTKLNLELWNTDSQRAQAELELLFGSSAMKVQELKICETTAGTNLISGILLEHVFPELKSLHLINATRFINNQFVKFLDQNCPALYSLKMHLWDCTCREVDVAAFTLIEIGNIRSLQLCTDIEDSFVPSPSNPIHEVFSNIISHFVNVENLNTDLFFFNKLISRLSGLRDQGQRVPVFATVTTLKIGIKASNGTFYIHDRDMDTYRSSFCSLKNLSLEVHGGEHSYCDCHNAISKALLFLGMHTGITSLEIGICAPSQISRMPENSFPGVKCIKLRSSTGVCSNGRTRKILNRFPFVEFLQVGNSVLDKHDIKTIRESEKIIKEFASRHRN